MLEFKENYFDKYWYDQREVRYLKGIFTEDEDQFKNETEK